MTTEKNGKYKKGHKSCVYHIDKWCTKAVSQIERKNYAARLVDDGMKKIIKYGIAFYKKHCKVMLQ